jgi:hypothetical protein
MVGGFQEFRAPFTGTGRRPGGKRGGGGVDRGDGIGGGGRGGGGGDLAGEGIRDVSKVRPAVAARVAVADQEIHGVHGDLGVGRCGPQIVARAVARILRRR